MSKRKETDVWVPTFCDMCYNCDGMLVHVVDGVAVKIEGNMDYPVTEGKACAKGNAGIMSLYDPNRVRTPLLRTNPEKGIGIDPKWKEIGWDEALNLVAEKLKAIKKDDPRRLCLGSFDASQWGLFSTFGIGFGTNNYLNLAAGYFCGNAVHPLAMTTHGSFYHEIDVEHTNYCLLVGCQSGFNLLLNPMHAAKAMADARLRGMKLVVVDPVCNYSASKADEWVPIRPGTDGAFALALINVLLNELRIYDADFLKRHTNAPYLIAPKGHYVRDKATGKPLVWDVKEGKSKTYDDESTGDYALEGTFDVGGGKCQPAFQLLKEHVKKYPPEKVSEITTIPPATIRRIAKEFGEAAGIGNSITLGGRKLPHRGAVVDWSKGVSAHKHGYWAGVAFQTLNILIGAIDVPGGHLGICGYGSFLGPNRGSFVPKEGPEGLLIPSDPHALWFQSSYPGGKPRTPQSIDALELFPVAIYSYVFQYFTLLNPEKFKIPRKPDMLIVCRSNIMMTTANPEEVAGLLKQFDFIVSFAVELDETAEFADLVLPDAHYLERLEFIPNSHAGMGIPTGLGPWCWALRQPVVEPPPNVRNWLETLLEIAHRGDFHADIYAAINNNLNLEEPYKLDLEKRYSWEGILDRWARSWFGEEHDLAWFKKHGYLALPKPVEEAYWRGFRSKPRIPVYWEHFPKLGEEVKEVTKKLGVEWDISDYKPLPDWNPCPSYEKKPMDYDLIAVTFKVPFQTLSITYRNPWLNALGDMDPYLLRILINTKTAARKGIKNGDRIRVEAEAGASYAVEGEAKLTECIHPEAVGIAGVAGHWAKRLPIARGKGNHFNRLLTHKIEHMDMLGSTLDSCVKVKVTKLPLQ